MSKIIDKIRFCANNLFQPHITNYQDDLTFVEFLMGILKKLNECIEQLNENTEFIDEFRSKYAELQARLTAAEEAISTTLPSLMDSKIAELRIEMQQLIQDTAAEINARITVEAARLDARIDGVAVGQINVYDPTTGIVSPLQQVINNLYDSSREEAITAEEFDDLELTASEFDAKELTAYQFDSQGKILLMENA